MTMLLGLCGAARSGKTTTANYLTINKSFQARAFADPLYDMLQAGFGIYVDGHTEMPIEWRHSLPYMLNIPDNDKQSEIRPFGVSLRHMLQTLGTEWGRTHINPDVWVQLADAWYSQHRSANVVFTDVRFPNEAEFIVSNGGHLIEVSRPQEDWSAFRSHVSEQHPLSNYVDYEINNIGTPADLHRQIDKVLDLYA